MDNLIKLIVYSKSQGKILVENEKNPDGIMLITKANCNMSINEFPTGELEINLIQRFEHLAQLNKGDIVEIFYYEKELNKYKLVLRGEIFKLNLKSKKDKFDQLNIKLINSFYKLQLAFINVDQIQFCKDLNDVVNTLVKVSNINAPVYLDDSVDNNFDISFALNFPAFSLLKIICIQKKLTFNFEQDNSLRITARETFMRNYRNAPIKTLTKDDIISTSLDL